MTAEERRTAILKILAQSSQPVSASTLAGRFGVSRQGRVHHRRGQGISAPPGTGGAAAPDRLPPPGAGHGAGAEYHGGQRLHGAGRHCGAPRLRPADRYDVQQFIRRSNAAQPLSLLTEGVHLHTLSCPGEDAFARVTEELDRAGFLLKRDE